MNRINRINPPYCRFRNYALFVALISLSLAFATQESRASDQDGVNGYSMRVKNKEFNGNETTGEDLTVQTSPSGKAAITGLQATRIEPAILEIRVLLEATYIHWLMLLSGRNWHN